MDIEIFFIIKFRRYYEPNEDVPLPLKLASCVSKDGKELKFIEPLVIEIEDLAN